MRGVQDDLLYVIFSLFPQLHISQSERRSEAGGLLCLPCWLFLSPLCHCQPQSVWNWQLFRKASSLTQHGVTAPLVGAGVLVFAPIFSPIYSDFAISRTHTDVCVLYYSSCVCVCKCQQVM